MVSFASRYIAGGIDAAPEEFSLAAACYATVAVVVILGHRYLVQTLGYRRMLRLSLLAFAAGAVLCATAHSVPVFIAGRMVQAVGGSAFFTASRVQVLHYSGKERIPALLCLPFGITLGSALAPILASELLDQGSWRALFWVMLPLTALVDRMVAHSVPEHEPVENEQPDKVHPWAILWLTLGMFLLQFMLERSRYDLFGHPASLAVAGILAAMLLLAYLWIDWRHRTPLISYAEFSSRRYWLGMGIYGFGYLVVSASNYILPIFMVQGLGFPVTASGWSLGLTSLAGLLTIPLHLALMMRWPALKPYLLVSLAGLCAFGWLMSDLGQESTLSSMIWPLILLNTLFMPFALGTAAASTFRGIDEKVFSHAYQVKNSMREVANSVGLSVATIIMQMRGNLHYSRLAETSAAIRPGYGTAAGGPDPWGLLGNPEPAALLRLAGEIDHQATLMACRDFFWGMAVVALATACGVCVARRIR
ncbi:MFS transporter [Paludibacterium paludis]|uniref:MFS transporter n=2 Tax=Paludibacterium paludis TaxID=1225769 RepID=A0A918NZY2_9NEIS|nr:MFS transporter [Paludibacterium paludis]